MISVLIFCSIETSAQDRPNVIVILTDDQGSIDLNSYGAADLYTSNIDGLATSGVRFTQFYAAAPICSPSRAALLTGMNPHAAGLPSNSSSQPGAKGMPTEKITIAEVLQETGYITGHVGKWHLGFSPETMPLAQGFDYSFGHMGGCIDNYSHFFYWNGPNRHDLFENNQEVYYDGQYFPDLMAEKVDSFIVNSKGNPFFLYYAINLPHYPLQSSEKWRTHYADLDHPRKDYAACISVVDEKIGQLLTTLESQGLRDNTIIIFQSDHGHSVEERAFYGGGNAGIFRGAKTSLFEGGIRVPAIISWPKRIQSNQVRSQSCISMDWFATIADYCQIPIHQIEGKSLRNIIDNNIGTSSQETFFWKQGVRWAIRQGPWKLLGLPNDPTGKIPLVPSKDMLFLSNIEIDPAERENLAEQYPNIKEKLLEQYLNWKYASPDDIPTESEDIPSLAKGKTIQLNTQPNRKYRANGANSLIDEQCGSRYFNDGQWLGFESNDLEVKIDLEEITTVNELRIGMLQDAASWIFYPTSITYSFSNDDERYTLQQTILLDEVADMTMKKINRLVIPVDSSAYRFIKVKIHNISKCPNWHPNAGSKAWLFVDEISVN